MEFLKKFQKGIDKALDIRSDDESPNSEEEEEHEHNNDSKVEDTEWNLDSPEDNIVVITEPNPVFDGHGTSDALLYLGSPNSSSPTEDNGENHATRSETENTEHIEHIDEFLSEDHRNDVPDDVATVASSDIEILKVDQRSNFSQNNSVNLFVSNPPNPKLVEVYNTRLAEMSEAKAICDNTIKSLQNQNKVLSQRLEKSLNSNKQFAETEKQLKDLTKEATKLSEINGKQSQEIKRLKSELQQLKVVTAARDNALVQLQEAMSKNQTLTEEIAELEDKLREEQEFRLQAEEELSQDQQNEERVSKLVDENQQLESEIRKLNHDIEDIKQELNDSKTLRFGSENELHQKIEELNGLTEEKERLERSMKLLKDSNIDLNKRIEQYIEKERSKAEELASIQNPLLSRIGELERKLKTSTNIEKEMIAKVRKLENDAMKSDKERIEYEEKLNESLSRSDYYKNESERLSKAVKSLKQTISSVQYNCKKYITVLSPLKEDVIVLQDSHENLYDILKKVGPVINKLLLEIDQLKQDKNNLVKELQIASNNALKQATTSIVNIRQPGISIEDQPLDYSFSDYTYTGSVKSALYEEYQDLHRRYDDILVQLKQSEEQLSKTLKELGFNKKSYEELKTDYDNMLVEYGARLEKIEALKEDVEDLRRLVKEQAMKLSSKDANGDF